MASEKKKKTVLLIGGTGQLGTMIARELLKKKASVNLRLLVRPGSKSKLSSDLASNAEVVENDKEAFKDVYSVVCSVQGGPDVIVDAQLGWLKAARDAGVKRFIPSSFSFNFFGLSDGENINSDWRREFGLKARQERGNVEVVHVMNGCFLDKGVLFGFLQMFDLEKGEAYQWGDGEMPIDLTTYADTAVYTAEVATEQQQSLPEQFFLSGETLTFHQLVDKVGKSLHSPPRSLTIKKMGSIDDLSAEIDRRQKAEPNNPMAWLPFMYLRGMMSGKGKLGKLQNDRFPHLKTMGVEEYVKQMG